MQRIGTKQLALPYVRHGGAVDSDDIVREARDVAAGHHWEFAESKRIVRRPKLARTFALL